MLNHFTDIMAGSYLDQCCADETVCGEFFSLYGDNLRGSLYNPLRALGLLAIDPTTESSFEPDELAAATGAPTEWFDDEHLCAPLQDVLPALGKLTLVWLSPMRTMALAQGALPGVKEDSLRAVETMGEVLAMNAKRSRVAH